MSLGHGAGIIRSGLVLNLDAANRKSYEGSGAIWKDLSGNGNNGTLVNGVAYSASNTGTMVFDGLDDYVDCGTMSSLNNTITGLTVSVFYKVGSAGTGIIAENGSSFTTNTFYIAQENALNLSFAIANDAGNYQRIYGTASYTIGTWYHFTGVWSSNNSLKAFINGVDTSQSLLSPVGNLSTVRAGNTNLWIGRRPGGSLPLSGTIGTIQIYTRALSNSEIQQNFNALRGRYGI